MKNLYHVVFDTQKNRNYITWGFYVRAHNQREATIYASMAWEQSGNAPYSSCEKKPHMFHLGAKRIKEEDRCRDCEKFYEIERRYANWGREKGEA